MVCFCCCCISAEFVDVERDDHTLYLHHNESTELFNSHWCAATPANQLYFCGRFPTTLTHIKSWDNWRMIVFCLNFMNRPNSNDIEMGGSWLSLTEHRWLESLEQTVMYGYASRSYIDSRTLYCSLVQFWSTENQWLNSVFKIIQTTCLLYSSVC